MISRSQMNRQLYADGTDDRGIMSQVRDLIQGIVPKSKYMLPLSKLEQIADAQGVSIEEANNMVMRWAMGNSDPKGLEKLFIPKMRRESQDVPEYYDPRLQILEPEQMREEMQDPSMPMRDMRMGGGIMSVARENYGIGSKFKRAVRKIIPNELADIAVKAAPFVAPFNPALAATMAGLGTFDQTGRIGQSLKAGALNYAGGQIARGIGGAELQGNPFGGGPIFTSPTTGNPITMDSVKNIFSTPEPFVGDEIYGPENAKASIATKVADSFRFLTGSSDSIGKVLNSISTDAMKNIIEAGKLGFALYSSKLAKEDQERINENLAEVDRKYKERVAAKKSEYGVGTPMIVTRGEVNPVRAAAAYGGRMGYAAGSVFRGIKKLSKLKKTKQTKLMEQLDEAYELAASRNDFDFNDYKMRGRLLAEELAEIRYGKEYNDLDFDTQLELYRESSDFLNDAAADYGDTMYDAFKERGGKANGGRMGYAYGSVDEGIMAAPQIANMMGMPVGNPRQNQQGVAELDYRDEGGFVPPIGIKEKEDDIPAMLSNNEFVFTANAVKNADPSGNRDPEEGAKVMYRTMKMLENGGMV